MTMQELYIALVELTESRNILLVEELPPCGVKHLRGLFWNNEEGSMIWINPTLSLAQKISTLAHELGHYMLHRTSGTNILHRSRRVPRKNDFRGGNGCLENNS